MKKVHIASNCFAYNNDKKECNALKDLDCNGCRFFKPKIGSIPTPFNTADLNDDEFLMITQRDGDGALYSTRSINIFHEIVDGYIQNFKTGAIVKELTNNEIIDIFNQCRGDRK